MKKIVFIVNPRSGGGTTGREWPRIRESAGKRLGTFTSVLTSHPGEAALLTRRHLLEGAGIIVCVGGDGTLNEVVNGFLDEAGPVQKDALIGFVPNGTGCDFVKSVPIPLDTERSLEAISLGESLAVDLGRIRFADREGRPCSRYFHNVASFGIGGEVTARAGRTTRVFGSGFSFLWSTLASVLSYREKRISLRLDGGPAREFTAWNVAVANGRSHGGGMLVAPEAEIDDGLLNVTVIGNLSLPEIFYHLPKLYNGRIGEVPMVQTFRCRKVEASADERVLLDLDGEQPGSLPAVIDIVPRAIRVLAGPIPRDASSKHSFAPSAG